MWQLPRVARPVSLVVFGATGDLFARKIVPALYLLFRERKLPDGFLVIGFGRRSFTIASFREQVLTQLKNAGGDMPDDAAQPFLSLFAYQQGEFDDDIAFAALGKTLARRDADLGTTALKSFYLAVPPALVPVLAPRIAGVAPRSREAAARGLLIEKPFGADETSARELTACLHRYFAEEELFRIDHYLAKPALDSLLHARTTHAEYNTLLATERIRSITVTLFETLGVETRGAFYDGVGTLRDVGQNHLLEMLALAIMPIPEMDAAHICSAREAFIRTLPLLSREHITKHTLRAQYDGYRTIADVAPKSETETYFRVSFALTAPPYAGVPVVLQAGKRMATMQKDIVIAFDSDHTDSLTVCLEPTPCLYTTKGKTNTNSIAFTDPEPNIQYANEYASLCMYAWSRDHTFFPTKKEVEYLWRFTDPIVAAWQSGTPALRRYEPNAVLPWEV